MRRDKTPNTLSTAAVGEAITGSYRKTEEGKLIANTIYLGAEVATKPEPKKEK